MLQLVLNTKGNSGKAELFIDYQNGSVGLTTITDKELQFDFSLEKEEWEQMKTFIEQAMSRDNIIT